MAQPERHLAALLSADAVGYSRLIAQDETGTVAALEDRRRFLSSLVEQRGGRVVDSPGDNLLAEFPSAVEAVRCAVHFQQGVGERNSRVPEERQMQFRVGIHLGELLARNGRLYGDGINVTARLERLAEAGGICVSRTVYAEVHGKLEIEFEDLGDREVKHVAEPVHVYRVRGPGVASTEAGIPPTFTPRAVRSTRAGHWLAAAAVAVGAIGAAVLFWPQDAPDKPIRSIAVLPLQNLSGDPEQEYFADGVTEDLIGALGQVGALRVPSHRSVLRFKDTTEPLPEIAAELGVDALIEGSVRREGDQVRITVQLIDGTTDYHLWHESYDEELSSILGLQARIARTVAQRVKVTLAADAADRLASERTVVPAAYDEYLRGRQLQSLHGLFAAPEQVEHLERAIALDPDFGQAHAWLGMAYFELAFARWAPPNEAMPKAREHALRAQELGAKDANQVLGYVALYYDRDWKTAREIFQRDGGESTYTMWADGVRLCILGELEVCLAKQREAEEAEPLDLNMRSLGLFSRVSARRYEEAIEGANALLAVVPRMPSAYHVLWIAHLLKGEHDEAVLALSRSLFQMNVNPPFFQSVYREAGLRGFLFAVLVEQERRWHKLGVGAADIASLYAYLGDEDSAFKWLDRAYDDRDPQLPMVVNAWPIMDPVRSDPRFTELAERLGIPMVEPDGPLVAPLPN